MSVASVTNKTLQLAELVISNEKFTGATGYVASSSSFSAGVTGTSLDVPNITVDTLTTGGDVTFTNSSFEGTTGYLPATALLDAMLTQIRFTSPLMTTQGLTIQGPTGSNLGVTYSGQNLELSAQSTGTTGTTGPYGVEIITTGGNTLLTVPESGTIAVPKIALNNGGGNIDIGVVGNVGGTTYNTDGTLTITRNLTNGDNEFDFIAINSTTGNGMNFYAGDGTTAITNATFPALSIQRGGIKPAAIYDSVGGFGVSGQILTCGADGGLIWADP
jgi:hypothetical protein